MSIGKQGDPAGNGADTPSRIIFRLDPASGVPTYLQLVHQVEQALRLGYLAQGDQLPRVKDVVRLDTGSGHTVKNGRWIVPQRIEARVRSGHLKLDFTQAVITQPSLQIDADVRSGHVILITKPGIVVDTDDVVVRSGHVRVRAPWGPDVPELLRIEVSGKVGSGHFVARPKYRTFWQWLTRQPWPYEIAAR